MTHLSFKAFLIEQFNSAAMGMYQSVRFKFCRNERDRPSMTAQILPKNSRVKGIDRFQYCHWFAKADESSAPNIMQCIASSRLFDLANLKFRIANDHVSDALTLCRSRSKSRS